LLYNVVGTPPPDFGNTRSGIWKGMAGAGAGSRWILKCVGSAVAVGLLFGSGALDAELGARKDPFGIRCFSTGSQPACQAVLDLPAPLTRRDTHFGAEMACLHGPHACRLLQLLLRRLSRCGWCCEQLVSGTTKSARVARPHPRALPRAGTSLSGHTLFLPDAICTSRECRGARRA
jgi:hypothetical protein